MKQKIYISKCKVVMEVKLVRNVLLHKSWIGSTGPTQNRNCVKETFFYNGELAVVIKDKDSCFYDNLLW
jgi:hypothetical protein